MTQSYKKYTVLSAILSSFVAFLIFSNLGLRFFNQSNELNLQIKDNIEVLSSAGAAQGRSNVERIVLPIDKPEDADSSITDYLKSIFPLISDNSLDKIIAGKSTHKSPAVDTAITGKYYAVVYVPKYFLDPAPEIEWVLNLPEFESRIYQIYQGDTILIDTWLASVGNPKTKTYPGHYRVFKMRNWPMWKNPEDAGSIPIPPGPHNPLGLFTVHFDEKSTRQFHGTNIDNVQKGSYGAVSHGCVRNNNDNMEKMKEFIIKKIIKSEDLSYLLDSKETVIYELNEEDRLPIVIIYKTFDIDKDELGDYIIFFKDVYDYSREHLVDAGDSTLITTTTVENVLKEFRRERPSIHIPDNIFIPLLNKLISEHEYEQKYYLRDIISI